MEVAPSTLVGTGAGKLRRHRDGGEIDLRQRRYRQQRIGYDPDQRQRPH
jgi:hypothetical protein